MQIGRVIPTKESHRPDMFSLVRAVLFHRLKPNIWLYQQLHKKRCGFVNLKRSFSNHKLQSTFFATVKVQFVYRQTIYVYSSRSKHIDIRHYYVREKCLQLMIKVTHTGTALMAADSLTKPLSKEKFVFCRNLCGLNNI